MFKDTAESLPKEKIRIAKTIIIPVSQLVKAHKLIDKIERELQKDRRLRKVEMLLCMFSIHPFYFTSNPYCSYHVFNTSG